MEKFKSHFIIYYLYFNTFKFRVNMALFKKTIGLDVSVLQDSVYEMFILI